MLNNNSIHISDQILSLADKLVKEDIESSLECLQMFDKQFTDVKTFYDILLYQTNNGWKCAIDIALDVSSMFQRFFLVMMEHITSATIFNYSLGHSGKCNYSGRIQ